MHLPDRSATRFLVVVTASVLVGAVLAAGQNIVLDPDADPVATFPGNVDIQGNLDLGGGQLSGVGGTQCGAGEALLGDGTCGSTGDVGDPWVNESGDTLNGDLDLNGNTLRNAQTESFRLPVGSDAW